MNQLITEKQVAAMLSISTNKLQKDRIQGKGIPFHKIERCIRYDLTEVEKYLEDCRCTSTSQYEGGSKDE